MQLSQRQKIFAWWVAIFVLLAFTLLTQSRFWGFVQDDTFISLRYARNLLNGHGLVFNPGEPVEGYSNFLWTVTGTLFMGLGLDALTALRVLGGVSALVLVGMLVLWSAEIRGRERKFWDLLPALSLGASSTLAAWSTSGLEQAFFALCGWASIFALQKGRMRLAAMLLLAVMLTRPEGILFLLFALWLTVVKPSVVISSSRLLFWKYAGVIAALFAAYVSWRYWYFGDLLPNTFYIKGGGGWVNAEQGIRSFKQLCLLNSNWFFLALAPLALIKKQGRWLTFSLLLFLIGYCLYEIKIGGDFLPLFRLHLTVLPVQYLLGVRALEALADGLTTLSRRALPRAADYLVAVVALLVLSLPFASMIRYSYGHPEFRGTESALRNAHAKVGEYLQAHSRPGDITVGQDMGMIPWTAPDVHFVDVIGLVDNTISQIYYNANYTPYIRYLLYRTETGRKNIADMESKVRDYLWSKNPRFFVVHANTHNQDYQTTQRAFSSGNMEMFDRLANANVLFNRIHTSPQWKNYRPVRIWRFSSVHYLLLYERMDHDLTAGAG
ncbi:MAG: hypothetical protein P8166_15070 [Candidatus Thiodiazotropha sp.]